jgi:DNA-directed RNA polymerase specialized sigma24 family protein
VGVRLVERARAGDHGAFRELIDLEGDGCYAIAFRIVRDVERAQDAVQEAFLIAWRDLPQLRDADRFKPWLHRLLVRACYAESRRSAAGPPRVRELIVEPATERDFTIDVANRDDMDRVVRRLSPEHRAVLTKVGGDHGLDRLIPAHASMDGLVLVFAIVPDLLWHGVPAASLSGRGASASR